MEGSEFREQFGRATAMKLHASNSVLGLFIFLPSCLPYLV